MVVCLYRGSKYLFSVDMCLFYREENLSLATTLHAVGFLNCCAESTVLKTNDTGEGDLVY